jgi:hypothetical protein
VNFEIGDRVLVFVNGEARTGKIENKGATMVGVNLGGGYIVRRHLHELRPFREPDTTLPTDCADVVPRAYERACAVLRGNAEYSAARGPLAARWKTSTSTSYILAAIGHAVSHMRGRTDEDHLSQAIARLLLASAIETEIEGVKKDHAGT